MRRLWRNVMGKGMMILWVAGGRAGHTPSEGCEISERWEVNVVDEQRGLGSQGEEEGQEGEEAEEEFVKVKGKGQGPCVGERGIIIIGV